MYIQKSNSISQRFVLIHLSSIFFLFYYFFCVYLLFLISIWKVFKVTYRCYKRPVSAQPSRARRSLRRSAAASTWRRSERRRPTMLAGWWTRTPTEWERPAADQTPWGCRRSHRPIARSSCPVRRSRERPLQRRDPTPSRWAVPSLSIRNWSGRLWERWKCPSRRCCLRWWRFHSAAWSSAASPRFQHHYYGLL